MLNGACICGAMTWTYEAPLVRALACNCTACSRYGALWAYGHEGVDVEVSGATTAFLRGEKGLGFHFCQTCGCVGYWRAVNPDDEGKRRCAVNLRLADEPEKVADLPVVHFDGLHWKAGPNDGRCVKDMWF